MLSISLGPVALPIAPALLLLAAWGASRMAANGTDKDHSAAADNAVLNATLIGVLAARLAHLGLHADL
jgi:prolipoprotein diacylglyceryltransferase